MLLVFHMVFSFFLLVTNYAGPVYPENLPPRSGEQDTSFALCLLVKNDPYLREWVDYHKNMGCSKFYIFDNLSSPPMSEGIQDHIDAGLVHYQTVSDEYGLMKQLHVFSDCVKQFGPSHDFMGFLDSDEFIVLKEPGVNIPQFLSRYSEYGGLVINWMVIGSSGHVKHPEGGLLKNYNKCFKNYHIKSIGNMKYVTDAGSSPHVLSYVEGKYAVDVSGKPVAGPWNPDSGVEGEQPEIVGSDMPDYLFEKIHLYHYYCKSREDFEGLLLHRGSVSGRKNILHFQRTDAKCTDVCPFLNPDGSLAPAPTPAPASAPLIAPPLPAPDAVSFAMCALVKNDVDLVEWLEYHRRLGCRRFYIFDDGSTSLMRASIEHYIQAGIVEFLAAPAATAGLTKLQQAHQSCIDQYGQMHDFMAFLDTDEFIVLRERGINIPQFLSRYSEYGGLALNMAVFGSSGHIARPRGGVLANYNRCFRTVLVKPIGNMRFVQGVGASSHELRYSAGKFAVDVASQPVLGPWNPLWNISDGVPDVASEKLPEQLFSSMHLNHYFCKSRQDYQAALFDTGDDAAGAAREQKSIANMAPFEQLDARSIREPSCQYLPMPPKYALAVAPYPGEF